MKTLQVILFMVVIVGQVSHLEAAKRQSKIKELARKFRHFGRNPQQGSSGVSYDELDTAYEEYTTSSDGEKFRASAREKSDSYRLFDDFVLSPMNLLRLAPDEDAQTKEAFMRRAEKYYRLFWASYVDKQLIGKKSIFNAKKFLRFVAAFEGTSNQEPTLELWQEARAQYEALALRAKEIVHNEDIYDRLRDYELLANFFNDARVVCLRENFFDRLDGCKSDKEVLRLKAKYRKHYSSQ